MKIHLHSNVNRFVSICTVMFQFVYKQLTLLSYKTRVYTKMIYISSLLKILNLT